MILAFPQISRPRFTGRAAAEKRAAVPQIVRPVLVLSHFVRPQIARPHLKGRLAVRSSMVVGERTQAPLGIPGRWPGVGESGIPQAWWSVSLPAGFICPLVAQLALLRGEESEYDEETGRLMVGGRVLVGTRGNEYRFQAGGDADLWVSINAARIASEVALVNGMSQSSAARFKTSKAEKSSGRAETIMRNAAKIDNHQLQTALASEAEFYLTKWEF